jgi:hypothetical protein
MTHEQYVKRRTKLIEYMIMKTQQGDDWHATADASMDLRDLDNYFKGYQQGLKDGTK